MFPEWTWIVGFGIGAAIGSFVNVVVYRMPRGMSLSKPAHSFCPACNHRLTALDLVPLLSWLFLRGRCRHCKGKVSSRYFWVELCVASLWAVIWYQHLVVATDVLSPDRVSAAVGTAHFIAYSLFAAALVAAIFTDLAYYIIPDQVNAFLLFIGIGLNIALIALNESSAWIGNVPSSLVGALCGWGVLWGIAFLGRVLFRKDAMGHGDIKMARGIGAVLLPGAAVMSFAVAIVLGAVIGVVILLVRRSRSDDASEPDEEPTEPETIGSLAKCGLGYLMAMDVVGLAFPKVYEWWFDENPYAYEEFEEDPVVELTMIPFGPYLATGALVVMLAASPLWALWGRYMAFIGIE